MNDRDDKNGVYSFLSSWVNEMLGIRICTLFTLTSVFWESPSHTHTYTPCRLIALQDNYLTRFLKRSPQSLLSWSCSLAGCAMQKVFKLNLSFRLCYGFGMGPSLTLQVGIALSGFSLTETFCNLRKRKHHLFFLPRWRFVQKHGVVIWWMSWDLGGFFRGSFRMYPTDGSQIQPMDLNGPWCFIRHGWRNILFDILQNPPRLCNIETSKWEDVYNVFFFNGATVGGFKHFLFSPLFGEDSHFDAYFSNGLKPPTRVANKFWFIILFFFTKFCSKNPRIFRRRRRTDRMSFFFDKVRWITSSLPWVRSMPLKP